MPEPGTSAAVEEVMFSIRKLVSEDIPDRNQMPTSPPLGQGDAGGAGREDDAGTEDAAPLVLSQALRVVAGQDADDEPDVALSEDGVPPVPGDAATTEVDPGHEMPDIEGDEDPISPQVLPVAEVLPDVGTEDHAEAGADASDPVSDLTMAEARDLLSADDPGLSTGIDPEDLRDLIAEIVREELQGALGDRITRNVRKLVRRELRRALTLQELD